MTDDDLVRQKEAIFYDNAVQAWIATRMEKDRSLLTLSTGGIGLLVALLTSVGPSCRAELLLFLAAGVAFIVSIICTLWIFSKNSAHLRDVVVRGKRDDDPLLVNLDLASAISFALGVVLSALVALSSGLAHLKRGEETVAGRETTQAEPVPFQKSLTGVGELRPTASAPAETAPAAPAPAAAPPEAGASQAPQATANTSTEK